MLFNSLAFLVFLPTVYFLYRAFPWRWQNRLLLIAGYVFYGAWDIRFLFLIAFSTTVDFTIGILLTQDRMPTRQRCIASTFLIGAALLFLCPNWSAVLKIADQGLVADSIWSLIDPTGLQVLAGTTLF